MKKQSTEADTLEAQQWVNKYLRGILEGRGTGRELMALAKEADVEGIKLFL